MLGEHRISYRELWAASVTFLSALLDVCHTVPGLLPPPRACDGLSARLGFRAWSGTIPIPLLRCLLGHHSCRIWR